MSVATPLPRVRDDPEFRPVVGAAAGGNSPEAGRYRRVVFNPFLGFAAVGVWAVATGWAWREAARGEGVFPMLAIVVGMLVGLPFLVFWSFRFHCLDCGGGGPAMRWRGHLCPRVTRRIFSARPARFRPPGPVVQGVLWVHVLAGLIAYCWQRGPWSP